MGSVGIVSIVVGLFAGYMLLSAVFVARMPAFQTDAFRALPPEAQRKRLRRARIFGIFGATYLMLFLVGLNVVQRWTLAREAHPASEEQYLRKMANDFNRELPRTVAPGVRMERVAVHPGLELAYTFTLVELTADKVDRARFAQVGRELAAQACANSDVRWGLDRGVTLKVAYVDKNRRPVVDSTIGAADCP